MKVLGSRAVSLLLFSFLAANLAAAQGYLFDVGTPLYTKAEPVELGFINIPNGNLHLEIPLTASPQRGKMQFSAALVYDSRIWNGPPVQGYQPTNVLTPTGGSSWGG